VLDITSSGSGITIAQSQAIQQAGKASGMFIGAGGEVLVATSGTGTNPAVPTVVTGSASQGAAAAGQSTAKIVGIAEKDQ